MQSLAEVRTDEFQQILTPGYILKARIISAALAFGIIALALAVLVIFFISAPQPAHETSRGTIEIMTIVNIVFICIFPLLGKFLYEQQFTPTALQKAVTFEIRDAKGNVIAMTPAEQCGMKIRSAWLIQAAMLEAPAFIGLSATMRAVQSGIISLHPLYAANGLAVLPALIYFATTFPSAESLRRTFEERIQNRR